MKPKLLNFNYLLLLRIVSFISFTWGYQPKFLFHSCLRSDVAASEQEFGGSIVILHGLLGASRNFQTWARLVHAKLNGSYDIVCIDLPNHGRSSRMGAFPLNYDHMAMDVQHTIYKLGLDRVHLIGHSMGGKAAAATCLHSPMLQIVRSLIIMDISPRHYSGEEFEDVTSSVKKLKIIDKRYVESSKIKVKEEAQKLLNAMAEELFEDMSLRMFVLSNAQLTQDTTDGSFKLRWSFHLQQIFDGLDAVASFPAETENIDAIKTGVAFTNPVLLLKGSDSNFIRSSHLKNVARMFPKYNLASIKNAGHWLHFEQPELSADRVAVFITSVEQYHKSQRGENTVYESSSLID